MMVQLRRARTRAEQRPADRLAAPAAAGVPRPGGHRLDQFALAPSDAPIQRTMHVSGAGVYTTETFKAGTRERPKQVILDVGGGTPRSKTPVALGALHDPGQPQGAADRFLGYDGGHVAGLQLGGANENYNVVPMYPGFNRGVWKNVEDEVAQAKTWGYSGMPFRAKIVLAYANSQRVVPRSLHMETTTRRRARTRRSARGRR